MEEAVPSIGTAHCVQRDFNMTGIPKEKKEYFREYYQKNKERIKTQARNYRQENKEVIKKKSRSQESRCRAHNYYKLNRDKLLAKSKKYRQDNADKVKKTKTKRYLDKNKDKIKNKIRVYSQRNKEEIRARNCEWNRKHRWQINERTRERMREDIQFRLRALLRKRLSSALKGKLKQGSAIKLLGCSIEFLKEHLSSKFKDNMDWDNHGQWHIDHIRPLISFNLEDEKQLEAACHYTNLQPLWAQDNLRKGSKFKKEDLWLRLCGCLASI